MDVALTRWINGPAGFHPVLDTILVGFTQLGVPLMVLVVMLQWWSKEDRPHVRHAALASGLSFLFGLAINQAILLFIHRIRPYDAGISHLIIAPSADWSFPSDHATASISIVAAFALQRLPRRTMALFLLAFVVCWSRVYVGTHYVTDVLGGACTGVISAIVVWLLYREGTRFDRLVTSIL
ncbi:MAG: phosphatase PAP2 family protein [Rhizobiaceae bacterium]